jgi:hypothetical protein
MTVLQFIRMHRIYKKFRKGHSNLGKAMERLMSVEQGLISYIAKYENTMKKDRGSFPNDLHRALDCIKEAYSILYPHRPMRDMIDVSERIKEMAEQEKAAEERKEQIKKLVRK